MVIVVWSLLVDVPSTCSSLNKCSQSLVDYFSVSFFLQLHFFWHPISICTLLCAVRRRDFFTYEIFIARARALFAKKNTESLQFQAKSIRSDIKNDISIEASLARGLFLHSVMLQSPRPRHAVVGAQVISKEECKNFYKAKKKNRDFHFVSRAKVEWNLPSSNIFSCQSLICMLARARR